MNNQHKLIKIFIGLLMVLIIAAGYNQFSKNKLLRVQIENSYQLAFIDLTTHLNTVEDELAKAMATSSKENLTMMMASVWRNIYAAQKSIGQLPLILTPVQETENLLFSIALFSEVSLKKLVDKEHITINYNRLSTYKEQLKFLNNSLQLIANDILTDNKSWVQLQQQIITSAGLPTDNSIAHDLQKVNDTLRQYPEIADFVPINTKKPAWYVNSKEISREESLEKFQEVLRDNLKNIITNNVEIVDTRGDIPGYMITLDSNRGEITGQITKKAGKLAWMIWDKPFIKGNIIEIDAVTANDNAINFLFANNVKVDVKEISRETTGEFYEFTFACVEENVICYPDLFWIKIAKDDGKVIGFNATKYLTNRQQRKFNNITISEQSVINNINPLLEEVRVLGLALINKEENEILVYEVVGNINQDSFIIFINANDGKEELIIRKN